MEKNQLNKLLSDFYLISGMEVSVLDGDFHTVAMARNLGKTFCSIIHRVDGAGGACKASDIEKLSQVKSNGLPLVYTCPYGITEAIVPIIRGDAVIAYIISSMGLNTDFINDFEILSIAESFSEKLSEQRLASYVKALKHLNSAQIEAFLTVLKLLAEHISSDYPHFLNSESIGKLIKSYIKDNLSSKLTLSDIAINLHCSTVTLTEHFKSEFGLTIVEYITKKRMQLAEKLLITTEMPLREVASMTGFVDVEYFSRTFKKHHGTSPAAWRKKEKD